MCEDKGGKEIFGDWSCVLLHRKKKGERAQKKNMIIYNWMLRGLEEAEDAEKIVLIDANGHVGSRRERMEERVVKESRGMEEGGRESGGKGDEEEEYYVHVGKEGQEKDNFNGREWRCFRERSEMVAMSTHKEGEWTYDGGRGGRQEWII